MEAGVFFRELAAAMAEKRPLALAVMVEAQGSVPQRPGAKMIVYEDGTTLGTVGGGQMELDVIERAKLAIEEGLPVLLSLKLSKENGSLCGGSARVYIEPVLPSTELIVVGAGHIGLALARFSKDLGWQTALLDNRVEYLKRAEEELKGLKTLIVDYSNPFRELAIGLSSSIVIATFSHAHDFDVVKAAIKTKAPYIGLVGSKSKRSALLEVLKEERVSDEDAARVVTPVGLSIGAVTPEEIAVSILAQIIQFRRSRELYKRYGTSPCRRNVSAHGESQAPA